MGKHKSKKHHKKYGDDDERSHKSRSSSILDSGEKPIKLVLKVSGGKETIVNKEKKPKIKDHSKKKKKKREKEEKERRKHKLDIASSSCASPASMSSHDKSKKKRDRIEMEGDDSLMDMERPIKKIHIKPIEPPPRPKPEPEPKPKAKKKPKADPTALQLCLENLLTIIQRKDVQGFFAFPVNDAIAPGYSRVIEKPMDFSTIRNKIDSGQYTTIEGFRDDFHLMCNNATIYNAPDTIYYKAAKRLLLIGDKMMTQDKIRNMYRTMGMRMSEIDTATKDLSDEPIDVDTIDSDHPVIPVHTTKKKPKPKSSKSDTRPSVVGRKILAQVQEAAKRVSAQLKEKYPNSKIGFLRRGKDGSTSLAFVNPDSAKESLPVNLGTTAGKVSAGSQVTTGFKEDKKNKATPVSYLMYGSFGSFAPTYDSSRATITKEESDLLLSTYGNDAGVHYAQSIQEFVRDTSSFANGVVDKLLDILTDGAHSVYTSKMREKEKVVEEVKPDDKKSTDSTDKDTGTPQHQQTKSAVPPKETKDKTNATKSSADVPIDYKSLMSLSEVGIDVAFLKDIADGKVSSQQEQPSCTLLDQLNSTSRLLEDLQEAQNSRLSSRPGDPLSSTPETSTKPSDKEQSIANRLTDTLKSITSQVGPGAVSEVESLRAAMGIGPVAVTPVDVKNQPVSKDA